MPTARATRIIAAIAKPPLPDSDRAGDGQFFDPWEDVLDGIHGSYAQASDDLAIRVLEAVRDATTFELIQEVGFAAEFMLYVMSGHGMLEYGTSPRGAWPHPDLKESWQQLIDAWKKYREANW